MALYKFRRMVANALVLLSLLLAVSLASCSVITKTLGAGGGGALGAVVGGPVGAGIGAGAGYLATEVAIKEEPVLSGSGSLTADDVLSIVSGEMRAERGFVETLEAQVFSAIRLVGGLALFTLVASLGYSFWRKRKASPFYERLAEIENALFSEE